MPAMICLFCGPKAKSFTRPEHIIPESLGNTAFVLHEVVCDKCNQYFSKLENYFIHHHLTSLARVFSVQRTKKGKSPMQSLPDGELRRDAGGKINFRQSVISGREGEQLSLTFLANEIILKGAVIFEDADAKKLSRFLAKCAIETLFFKRGNEAFQDLYDPLREYARYGGGVKFVPFLWSNQEERLCDLLHASVSVKGINQPFDFAVIFVPGSVYFIPLSRFDEPIAMEKLEAKYDLKWILHPQLIERDPFRYEVRRGGGETKDPIQ
jgi:hypothetical protein